MVCCFLGHRDAPDLLNELTMTIEELIINHSADIFFVGTHGNFDKQVAYILDKMKSIYPHIVYNIVLAYLPVEKKMSALIIPTQYIPMVLKKYRRDLQFHIEING